MNTGLRHLKDILKISQKIVFDVFQYILTVLKIYSIHKDRHKLHDQ